MSVPLVSPRPRRSQVAAATPSSWHAAASPEPCSRRCPAAKHFWRPGLSLLHGARWVWVTTLHAHALDHVFTPPYVHRAFLSTAAGFFSCSRRQASARAPSLVPGHSMERRRGHSMERRRGHSRAPRAISNERRRERTFSGIFARELGRRSLDSGARGGGGLGSSGSGLSRGGEGARDGAGGRCGRLGHCIRDLVISRGEPVGRRGRRGERLHATTVFATWSSPAANLLRSFAIGGVSVIEAWISTSMPEIVTPSL